MRTLVILLMFTGIIHAQEVDILDKNRKVIKSVDEKELKRTVDSIGEKAQFTARWIEYKTKECFIKRDELENILI
jgi:hypothetical protein